MPFLHDRCSKDDSLIVAYHPLTIIHHSPGGCLASAASRSRNREKTQKRIDARPNLGQPASPRRLIFFLGLLLASATLALYFPVRHHPFVNYDDDEYVTDNVHVKAGLAGRSEEHTSELQSRPH